MEEKDPASTDAAEETKESGIVDLMVAKQQIEELEAKVREYEDIAKRTRAESENMRKRMEKEKAEFLKFSNKKLIVSFLDFLDDFDRALKTDIKDARDFFDGMTLIHKRLINILDSYGVKEIAALNTEFDPNIHEAISLEESSDYDHEKVIEVYQKGYKMYDDVIRTVKVRVGRPKPQAAEQPAEMNNNN
ncbi:MAG: nucleotide exchange factor GrpE [Spirochaetes bacterium]|nr:nucleotide exchange factor GrpE [Spirochaetota bacterium]